MGRLVDYDKMLSVFQKIYDEIEKVHIHEIGEFKRAEAECVSEIKQLKKKLDSHEPAEYRFQSRISRLGNELNEQRVINRRLRKLNSQYKLNYDGLLAQKKKAWDFYLQHKALIDSTILQSIRVRKPALSAGVYKTVIESDNPYSQEQGFMDNHGRNSHGGRDKRDTDDVEEGVNGWISFYLSREFSEAL